MCGRQENRNTTVFAVCNEIFYPHPPFSYTKIFVWISGICGGSWKCYIFLKSLESRWKKKQHNIFNFKTEIKLKFMFSNNGWKLPQKWIIDLSFLRIMFWKYQKFSKYKLLIIKVQVSKHTQSKTDDFGP